LCACDAGKHLRLVFSRSGITGKGFQVSGTKLLDASGNELVMRGMRDISAIDLVKEIKIGWNLGNTLDAPTETAWEIQGQPRQ